MTMDLTDSNLPKKVFAAGETIVRPGDEERLIYLLAEGAIDVILDGASFRTIRDRMTFIGELAALTGAEHSAHVRALEDCTCYVIEDLGELFRTHRDIYLQIATDIAHKTKANMLRMFALKQRILDLAGLLGLNARIDPRLGRFLECWAEIYRQTMDSWPCTLEAHRETDEVRTYAAGEHLFVEGENPGQLFVLLRGRVALEQRTPGDLLPEYSTPCSAINLGECIPGMPPFASARALEDSEVRTIGELPDRFANDPDFGPSVTRIFARRLQVMTDTMHRIRSAMAELLDMYGGSQKGPLGELARILEQSETEMLAGAGEATVAEG